MTQIVGGRYQLIAQLGGGGMADVFLAKMVGKADFAKLAVVKRLKSIEDEDPEVARMFADEARLCARLNHPNIVQTFEVGEDNDGPFLVMEYLEGQPLARIRSRATKRGTTIPRNVGVHVICETLAALAYAHSLADHDGTMLRVVHRDVSPENVMVTYAGMTKLVDFGVAKTAASTSRTRAGILKGKIAYMAPEQARSDVSIDARADIFAVGLVLWELLAGRRMWEGFSEAQVVSTLLDNEQLPRLELVDDRIHGDFDEICARALAKDRSDRFTTASEMLEALEEACQKHDMRATPREVGQFVTSLFDKERDKLKHLVQTSLTRLATDVSTSLPRLTGRGAEHGLMSGNGVTHNSLWGSSGGLSGGSQSGAVETAGPTVDSFSQGHPPAGRDRRIIIGASIAGAGILLAVVALTKLGGPTGDAAPADSARIAAPSETSSAPVAEVTVDITAKPAAARIYLDGKSVAGNPHRITTARTDKQHEVRAEADGFEAMSMVVAFDRDRSIELPLVAKSQAAQAPVQPVVAIRPTPVAHGASHAVAHPATVTPPAPTPTTPPTAALPLAPAPTKGISEIDTSKSAGGKQDKIDTDVFRR